MVADVNTRLLSLYSTLSRLDDRLCNNFLSISHSLISIAGIKSDFLIWDWKSRPCFHRVYWVSEALNISQLWLLNKVQPLSLVDSEDITSILTVTLSTLSFISPLSLIIQSSLYISLYIYLASISLFPLSLSPVSFALSSSFTHSCTISRSLFSFAHTPSLLFLHFSLSLSLSPFSSSLCSLSHSVNLLLSISLYPHLSAFSLIIQSFLHSTHSRLLPLSLSLSLRTLLVSLHSSSFIHSFSAIYLSVSLSLPLRPYSAIILIPSSVSLSLSLSPFSLSLLLSFHPYTLSLSLIYLFIEHRY